MVEVINVPMESIHKVYSIMRNRKPKAITLPAQWLRFVESKAGKEVVAINMVVHEDHLTLFPEYEYKVGRK